MINIPEIPQASFFKEDFNVEYPIDFKYKTVLDIGADRGSTASHFLRNGATFVNCVEGNPVLYDQLVKNLDSLGNCSAYFLWIDTPEKMAQSLSLQGDIVKMDIEGAEKHLIELDPQIILQHREYIIEVHGRVDSNAVILKFTDLGFQAEVVDKSFRNKVIHFYF